MAWSPPGSHDQHSDLPYHLLVGDMPEWDPSLILKDGVIYNTLPATDVGRQLREPGDYPFAVAIFLNITLVFSSVMSGLQWEGKGLLPRL